VNSSARSRLILAVLVVFFSALSIAGYKAYAAFYNRPLERSEAWHLTVEEVSGTSPLQLRITTDTMQSAPVIRRVTIRRRDTEMTVQYHLALAGLAKPTLNWGEAYKLTIPDSVNEVRFGHHGEVIWRRSKPTNCVAGQSPPTLQYWLINISTCLLRG
jgi:hypothetical protein